MHVLGDAVFYQDANAAPDTDPDGTLEIFYDEDAGGHLVVGCSLASRTMAEAADMLQRMADHCRGMDPRRVLN